MMDPDAHIPLYRTDRCIEHYLPVAAGPYVEIQQFLAFEALLLDHCRYRQWLALLAPDFHYRMVDRPSNDAVALHQLSPLVEHSHASIGRHFDILSRPNQSTPIQVRRLITNLTVSNAAHGEYQVISYLLLNCLASDSPQGKMYTVQRHDFLGRAGRTFRVVNREVIVDRMAQELAWQQVIT